MTEQEYKEICAEIENSGIPVPSQKKIIDACGKQVAREYIQTEAYYGGTYKCPICRAILYWNQRYCDECGQKLDWSDEE